MDQAAAQPARASSAAPSHDTTITAAQIIQSAPPHAATGAHTGQPAPGFWAKTLDPSVFWNAASAVATFAAIVAAFLIPWFTERRQQQRRQEYARLFLLPVYDEIRLIAQEASECRDNCTRMADGLRHPDKGSPGLYWNDRRGLCLTSDASDRLRNLTTNALTAYAANRTWISDLQPQEAGRIHSDLHDTIRLLNDLASLVGKWPHAVALMARHLDEYLQVVKPLAQVSSRAADRLGAVVGEPKMASFTQ